MTHDHLEMENSAGARQIHAFCSAISKDFQIPPDFAVKSQAIDIVDVIRDQSGDQTSSNCRVETGNQDLSCHHHLRVIGLPLNAMECEGDDCTHLSGVVRGGTLPSAPGWTLRSSASTL
jgi:hypothetical protein